MIHIVIIPIGLVAVTQPIAWSLGIAPQGQRVLMRDLVPADGDADAETTHVGGRGKLGETEEECEERRAALEAGFQGGHFPGALWWRMDDAGLLEASHLGEAEPQIDQPWDWQKALTAAGLQERVEGELYPPDPA
jgi:hypothetical protein